MTASSDHRDRGGAAAPLPCHLLEQIDHGPGRGPLREPDQGDRAEARAAGPRPPERERGPRAQARARRRAAGGRTWTERAWRNPRGRTMLASVRRCETGRAFVLTAPSDPQGPADLALRRFRCWSPSCRRCGPTVGAQDLARLEPAITGQRWLYLVLTLGPAELERGAARARARRQAAFAAWTERVEAVLGPRPVADRTAPPTEDWEGWRDLEAPLRERGGALAAEREWYRRAREVERPPRAARLSPNPYHVAATCWTDRLVRRCRHRWPELSHVVTWESTRRGVPHANVLLRAPDLLDELLVDEIRAGTAGGGRRARYPRRTRQLIRRWAREAGFGRVCWVELADARSNVLALYVAKLAREVASPDGKDQAPLNRPRGFRRYSASKGLLEPRTWPKRRHPDEAPGNLALLPSTDPARVARAVRGFGMDGPSHAAFRELADRVADGRERVPLYDDVLEVLDAPQGP